MYSLVLVICVALVVLSPLALELYLTLAEKRQERRRLVRERVRKAKGPGLAWTPAELQQSMR